MDDLGFGLGVALAGLSIVFGLLIVLWLLLAVALRFDRQVASPPSTVVAGRPGDLEPRLAAAITLAVIRHTDTLRRQAAPAMRSHAPGSQLFASHWVASGRMRQGQPWRRRAR